MTERETVDIEESELDDSGDFAEPTPVEATLEQFGEDEADDSGVVEALRAWAAGGHTADDDSGGDEILPVQFAQLEPPGPQNIKPRYGRINNGFVDMTVELG